MAALKADMSLNDCFAYFNPTDAAGVEEVRAQWTEALLRAAEFHITPPPAGV